VKRKNIEFLIGFLDALRRDDRDAVRAALKPDIVWQGVRPDLICHDADEVTDMFVGNRDHHYREIERVELIGAERHAILHAAGGDVTEVAGIPLQDGMYNVFANENGIAVRIDDYAERRAAFEARRAPLGGDQARSLDLLRRFAARTQKVTGSDRRHLPVRMAGVRQAFQSSLRPADRAREVHACRPARELRAIPKPA
jgi:hypothetical protein